MPTLAIDKGFLTDFGKLDKPVAKRVTEVFDKFDSATHTGLHLEKIANARNPRFRSIRIDQAWRGIVLAPVTGDVYTLLKVLHHDDAYTWAQRSNVSVNSATGGIEIRDEAELDRHLPAQAEAAPTAATPRSGGRWCWRSASTPPTPTWRPSGPGGVAGWDRCSAPRPGRRSSSSSEP